MFIIDKKIVELREMYKSETDPEKKEQIKTAGIALKNGEQFGSKEVSGNGLCYTCCIRPARSNAWNCSQCAQDNEDDFYRRLERLKLGRKGLKQQDKVLENETMHALM